MSDLSWLNPTPHAIAVYASQPPSPVATQHSLPSGRYSLLGPDFHRLDRTSLRLAHLLDHLVGAGGQTWRHLDAERPRGLEIDHQLVFGRRLHRQVGRLFAFEDAIHVRSGTAVLVSKIRSIRHQAASSGDVALKVHRRQLMPRCECNDEIAIEPSGRAPRHDQTPIRRAREGRDSAFDLTGFAQVDRGYLHPEQWRHSLYDGKVAG